MRTSLSVHDVIIEQDEQGSMNFHGLRYCFSIEPDDNVWRTRTAPAEIPLTHIAPFTLAPLTQLREVLGANS